VVAEEAEAGAAGKPIFAEFGGIFLGYQNGFRHPTFGVFPNPEGLTGDETKIRQTQFMHEKNPRGPKKTSKV
jgi:hypothetical protein